MWVWVWVRFCRVAVARAAAHRLSARHRHVCAQAVAVVTRTFWTSPSFQDKTGVQVVHEQLDASHALDRKHLFIKKSEETRVRTWLLQRARKNAYTPEDD